MRSSFLSPFRFYLVYCSIFLVFCLLGGRLVYLQVVKGPALLESAESARKNFSAMRARRGDVVDAKGNLLATTRSVVEVGLDPQCVNPEDLSKLPKLASLLGLEEYKVREAFLTKTRRGKDFEGEVRQIRWTKLVDEVEEDVYRKIKELNIRGLYGNYKHSRLYPNKKLAAHVIGFVNKEGLAAMGVERMADYYLSGQDGWRESECDGKRRELLQYRSREVPPVDGLNIELSVDRMIQDVVEKELTNIVEEFDPVSASIIVSEPATGYVLAMGNAPDFDPNLFNKAEMSHQRNRALTDLYEPGSTFKIVASGAAMNENLVTKDTVVDCSKPSVFRGNRKYRLPRDHHPLGKISVHEVMVNSSNRGAGQLGVILGRSRLYEYCRAFGFGQSTDLGLRGERKGILHAPDRWDGLTITRLPMGHAVSVTPMQIHSAMGAVANDCVLMKPQLIRRVFDAEGKTVVEFRPKSVRRVLRSDVAEALTDMLVGVVEEGTAKKARVVGYRVAGKTGTTQKIVDGRYSNRHHVASFVGFLPADDPRLMVTVMVDEPKMQGARLGYGGSVAGPAFSRVAKSVAGYLGIMPSEQKKELAALPSRLSQRL